MRGYERVLGLLRTVLDSLSRRRYSRATTIRIAGQRWNWRVMMTDEIHYRKRGKSVRLYNPKKEPTEWIEITYSKKNNLKKY
jgi:hypothetical protein